MSSDPSPRLYETSDEADDRLDLQAVFQHPAGLRTARFIVTSFLNASRNASADGLFSSVSLPFLDTDGSGSEAAKILRDLLAFKDTEEEGQDDTGSIFNSHLDFQQSSQLSANSRGILSPIQMVVDSNPNDSPHVNDPTIGYTSFQPYNASNTNNSMNAAVGSGQHRHGTDSPYRVESPFRAESDANIQASSSSSSKTQPHSFSALRQGLNRYNIDHPLPISASVSSYNNINTTTEDFTMKEGMDRTSSASRFPGRPAHKSSTASNTGRAITKEPPSIKSFLPVNKGGEGYSMPTRKEQLILHSMTNRRLMPNSLAPANSFTRRGSGSDSPVNFSSPSHTQSLLQDTLESTAMEISSSAKGAGRKRKSKGDADGSTEKKKKTNDKGEKVKRAPKAKLPKPEPARYRIGLDLWMRILEFTPPSFIRKARLLSKDFNKLVDTYQSIYLNQRMENYGPDMPAPLVHITEKQYNDLLSGKGCMEPGCGDSKASRTHWSWEIRLCQNCWKSKIEREDRLQKMWQNQLTRNGINRLLECIPVGMHDSFMKPHDYIEDVESRPRGAPRLYRYHFKSDVEKIVEEYEALKAPPFQENPEHSAAEKAAALASHQALEAEFVTKRTEFIEARKAKNDEHMKRVVKIETCVRNRRSEVAKPYDANRAARKERFTSGAERELAHIPLEFVKSTKCYKAAVRIFRDPGTERGWQLLKPKIQEEWDKSAERKTIEERSNRGTTVDTTTRETSIANDSEQTPDPTLDQAQNQVQRHPQAGPHPLHAHHQHFHNMAAQRNDFILRANDLNQFRPIVYNSGMNQPSMQGYQHQNVPASQMLHTTPYAHDAMNTNDFAMAGSGLQLNPSYVSYSTFPPGNNFANFSNNSASQGSNTQIPITSLLNNSSSAAAHNFDPWA